MCQRSSAAVTCRLSVRSGVMRAAVSRPRRPAAGASRWRAPRPRVGRLDQRDIGHRGGEIAQVWPVAQPLIGDRRGAQGQRDEPVARGVRGVRRTMGDVLRGDARALGNRAKRYCGWSSEVIGSASASQTWAGASKSKPGSTTAPCGSRATACIRSCVAPREPVEPATMIGIAGASCGPEIGQPFDHQALPGFHVGGSGSASK